MNIMDAYPSKYLKASDLGGATPIVTISHVQVEEVGRGDKKPVAYFVGKQKGVVLNKTNANNISDAYGFDTDQWTGKAVMLYTAMVDYEGRSQEAIRIRPAPSKQAPPPPLAQPAVPPQFDPLDQALDDGGFPGDSPNF